MKLDCTQPAAETNTLTPASVLVEGTILWKVHEKKKKTKNAEEIN